MGRIKPALVKRTANQILAQKVESFSTDFTHNKTMLTGAKMPSKKMRNKIAGQITRELKNRQKKRKTE